MFGITMVTSWYHGIMVSWYHYGHYDSYDEDPISRAGLGGVLRFELLLDPRECRGEPSRFES